ncbi:hypothetical protein [Methylophaga sp. OBS3]|uniref:hypothetical protein n=1 Tax=Methylophaga sp. OBS3 TaxID=2991934 RepID=UPI00225105E7|nr:hypothetical protein [Methylophaga sp. OBS3]MCX4190809.1 hypothetical protein [Methylophaga sp. OBS3]
MDTLFNNLCQTLYENDPMGTCCKENECFDEYNHIAAQTADLMDQGYPFKAALTSVLSDSFTKDMANKVDYEAIEKDFNGLKA